MNEIVKITYDNNDRITVLGRELHRMLEVKDHYTDWFKRMCEYGFTKDVDFVSLSEKSEKPQGGRPLTDHQLTIDMAKEIAMLQRTEKGKQVRQYFIQLEKDWNSPEKVMARALSVANKTLEEFKSRTYELEAKVEEQRPKVIFAESVQASKSTILVGEMAKLIKQNGIDMGEKRLFKWLRDNGYLISRQGTDYNMPTQKSAELGVITFKETAINHSDGHITVAKTPKITGKGQIYFINKLKETN